MAVREKKIKQSKVIAGSLGSISAALVIASICTWAFLNNAQNCLNRDFETHAEPAICWRQMNDYENVIGYSSIVLAVLAILSVVSISAMLSVRLCRSVAAAANHERLTILFVAASVMSLLISALVFAIYSQTTFNNNNYILNTAMNLTFYFGVPAFIAASTAASVFLFSRQKRGRPSS